MTALELQAEWLTPDDQDDLFGPERTTFAALAVVLDSACLTNNSGGDSAPAGVPKRRTVQGPMSGLAEWVVDNWLYVLWEGHTPFRKASEGARIPSLVDVRKGTTPDVAHAAFAAWYGRHSLGHSSSDLALPVVTFLPEDKVVGVFAARPLRGYQASVHFDGPWPKEPVWIPKDECSTILSGFVLEVLARAGSENSTRQWSEWLRARFDTVKIAAQDEAVRRKLMLGTVAADNWEAIAEPLGAAAAALSGILADSEIVESAADLKQLANAVARVDKAPAGNSERWKHVGSQASDRMLVPYKRGYKLARQARATLGLGTKPLSDIREVLHGLDVDLERFDGPELFRSASLVGTNGKAQVCVSGKLGVAQNRFATSAALGRLLAEGSRALGPFGCAHGQQSRWQKTQEAKAFAAEFLLPAEVFSAGDRLDRLSDAYGISRHAATLHHENWENRALD